MRLQWIKMRFTVWERLGRPATKLFSKALWVFYTVGHCE